MSISTNEVIRVTANMLIDGADLVNNVFHLQLDSTGIGNEDALEDAAEWVEDIYGTMVTAIVNNLSFETVRVINQSDNTDVGLIAFPTLTVGSATGEMLPLGASALIQLLTGILGSQGKKYMPVTGEGALADGLWGSSYLTTLGNVASLMLDPFSSALGNDWHMVVWSEKYAAPLQILSTLVSAVPAYQRRRRQGRGE